MRRIIRSLQTGRIDFSIFVGLPGFLPEISWIEGVRIRVFSVALARTVGALAGNSVAAWRLVQSLSAPCRRGRRRSELGAGDGAHVAGKESVSPSGFLSRDAWIDAARIRVFG